MAFDPSVDAGPVNQGGGSDWMQQLLAALAAVGGGLGGRAIANAGGDPLTRAVPPEFSQLMQMSNQRYAYQNPLFQATTQGVYDMLPDFAKTGTSMSGGLSNQIPIASASGGNVGGLAAGAAGLGGLSALMAFLSQNKTAQGAAGNGLESVLEAIKKKYHPTDPPIQMGGGAAGGGMSPIPGYFQNPDGSLVGIGGDPANGGGYGGGLFPVNGNGPERANGGGEWGPFKD